MKKINIRNLCINLSLLIFVLISTVRTYLDSFFSTKMAMILYAFAIVLLLIVLIKQRKIKLKNNKFVILCFFMFIPSIYNNAYIQNDRLLQYLYYILTVIYVIFLYFCDIRKNNIEFCLNLFILFSLLTSFVTWISFINPDIYISKFIPLLPIGNQDEVYRNFVYNNNRMGLTTHYSRNAFFIVLGIISLLYYYLSKKNKRAFLGIVFLFITLLVVGKRGHLIFILISLIISYFIHYRVNYKTVMKFCIGIVAFILFVILCTKYIPGTQLAFQRIFENENDDISNGRIEMYQDIFNQFKENNYIPLGWGQYAKSTDYVHPGVHNDYIQILCETGLIGFIFIIGTNIVILIKAIKYSQKTSSAISFVILVYNVFYLIYSLTGLPHFDFETYMFYFYINCILYYFSYNDDKSIKEIN